MPSDHNSRLPTQSHKSHFPNTAREKRAQKHRKAKATFKGREADPSPNLRSPSIFTTPGWHVGRLPWALGFFPMVRQFLLPRKSQPIQFCSALDDFCNLLFCSHSTNRTFLWVARSGVLVAQPRAPPPRNRSYRGSPRTSAPVSPGGLGQTGHFGHHPRPPQVRVRGAGRAARCRRH